MRLATCIVAVAFLAAEVTPSLACACCADYGDRFVEAVAVTGRETEVLAALRFDANAHTTWGDEYSQAVDVSVRMESDRWVFSFALGDGRNAHLDFALPQKITRFEVDPRDPNAEMAPWGGPLLYKEWRMSSKAAGAGFLSDRLGGDQMASLILHGRGNHCPVSSDFEAWTIVLYGSKGQVTTFGRLDVRG